MGQGLGLCIQSFIYSLPCDRQENWVSMTNPTKAMIPWSGMSFTRPKQCPGLAESCSVEGK